MFKKPFVVLLPMNLVAHQFLSFGNSSLQVGNFLAEEIKGNKYLSFQEQIQTGILLHRHIDSFMDTHPLVLESAKRLYPYYSKYTFVVLDIFYDYLLIKNWHAFHEQSFQAFSTDCYTLLEENLTLFSPRMQEMVYKIKERNWYARYASIEGLKEVFYLQNKRTKAPYVIEGAEKILEEFECEFNEAFLQFFPEICSFAEAFVKNRTN